MRLLIKFISSSFGLFFCLFGWTCISQGQPYPTSYFGSPLTIPLTLAGNFGEIRSHHFHSGLDFKTDSMVGKPVIAAADGYVSRIKVSAAGFGKALYLTHPAGFVTVYGHLHHFKDTIQQFILQEQYAKEQFETELFPDGNLFIVKKGDTIAWSGNTGGSEGPHLHFEIRDLKTEKPINPLLFGYSIADTIPPVLDKVIFKGFYKNTLQLQPPDVKISVGTNPNSTDTISLAGTYGFTFSGYDLANGQHNHLGIYRIKLTCDDSIVYDLTFSSFSFDETRYVNAHIDYERKVKEQEVLERCYRLPGDFFSLNSFNSDSILPEFVPGKNVRLTLTLFDYNGNKTEKKLFLRGTLDTLVQTKNLLTENEKQHRTKKLLFNQANRFGDAIISIEIPLKALYEDGFIQFSSENYPKPYFPGQQQHRLIGVIPFHVPFSLTLKEPQFPVLLRNKGCIVMQGERNKFIYLGGIFKGDSITVKTRALGTILVYADTLPPVIKDYKVVLDSLFNKKLFTIPIQDDLSGIASFRATLDQKWILMEYDEKTGTLFYTFDPAEFITGKSFRLVVTDRKENETIYETVIEN